MFKSIIFTCLLFALILSSSAHQLNFYGYCNKIPLPNCTINWNSMTSSDSALYVVGNNGACFISYHNGGIKSISTGTTNNLTGIQFLNNSIGFTWGEQGTLLKTIDGGITWTTIATDTSSTIDKVQFTDVNHGFFMVDSIIHKTVNGGATWTKVSVPSSVPITDFHFFDSMNGQICGGTLNPSALGYLYQTTNGGVTWNQIYTNSIYFKKLFYTNDSTGYLYGINNSNPVLYQTTNTGIAWNLTYSNATWTLASDVINFSNQTTFASNETEGTTIYGTPQFNTLDGIAIGATNIYSLKNNGVEMLYVIAQSGLYRYINGGPIYANTDFFDRIIPDSTNPTNTLIPGSKVKFKISVYNVILSTVINLNGKIRCYSPYITITDSLGSYNNVLSHNTTFNSDVYEMQLSTNIPNNYVPQFQLLLGDPLQAGGTWNSIFSFPIILSPFIISQNSIEDDSVPNSHGNNDQIAEPGETIQITPYADNTTQNSFANIIGYLFSPQNEIHIWADTMGYTDTVYNHYYYGTFPSMIQNIQPVQKFVFTDNFKATYYLPFAMIFTGNINSFQADNTGCIITEYDNVVYRWAANFSMNDGYPNPLAIEVFEDNTNNKFILFPNPGDGKYVLKIKNKNEELENIKIEISNLLGEQIYQSAIKQFKNVTIDISGQPEGVYFLKITSEKGDDTIKMINF